MRLGGEGKVKVSKFVFPGCLGKMRNTVEVWVSHRKQEEGAGRVHSSFDPFRQNSQEDRKVMCWVRHNQYASPLAAQECGLQEQFSGHF